MDTTPYKEMLLRKRGEILAEGSSKQITASMDTNTRQGDLADQATGNNEVHIQLKAQADRRQDSPGHRRSAGAD